MIVSKQHKRRTNKRKRAAWNIASWRGAVESEAQFLSRCKIEAARVLSALTGTVILPISMKAHVVANDLEEEDIGLTDFVDQNRDFCEEAVSRWQQIDEKFAASDRAIKDLQDRQAHQDAQGKKVIVLEEKVAAQAAELGVLKEQNSKSALHEAQLVVRQLVKATRMKVAGRPSSEWHQNLTDTDRVKIESADRSQFPNLGTQAWDIVLGHTEIEAYGEPCHSRSMNKIAHPTLELTNTLEAIQFVLAVASDQIPLHQMAQELFK